MTRLAIIIPVKNDARRLAACLTAIARNRHNDVAVEIIVVDNGSSDDSPAVAAAAGAKVLTLPDLRVSALRNEGAATATADILAFVDADHEIVPTWIAAGTEVLATESVGAAGALYSAPQPGTWVQHAYGVLRGRSKGHAEVGWLGSGNLVVKRSAFEQVRGFDASLEACEDVDFCQRLRSAGWKIVADERLESVHQGDPATLMALFRAERWRGRDNIRVSLRGPLSLRDVPSMVLPVVTLGALFVIALGVALGLAGWATLPLTAAAAIVVVGLAGAKTTRMALRARTSPPVFLLQAFAVALTYDLARAIALITRAPHHRGPRTTPAAPSQ